MTVRLAVRAVIVEDGRLLVVNAYPPSIGSSLMCCPGGGVEAHLSVIDNLRREVREETGAEVEVGPLVLVNEFHDPEGAFHQVELFYRCTLTAGGRKVDRPDPEGVVTERRWVTRAELQVTPHKPDSLSDVAWSDGPVRYDPLEPLQR